MNKFATILLTLALATATLQVEVAPECLLAVQRFEVSIKSIDLQNTDMLPMVAISLFGSFSGMKVACKDMDREKMITLAAELIFGEQAVKDTQCNSSLTNFINLIPRPQEKNLTSPFHLRKHAASFFGKFTGKGKKGSDKEVKAEDEAVEPEDEVVDGADESDEEEFFLRQAAPAQEKNLSLPHPHLKRRASTVYAKLRGHSHHGEEEGGDSDDSEEFYLRQAAPAQESPLIKIINLVRAAADTYKVCKSVSQASETKMF